MKGQISSSANNGDPLIKANIIKHNVSDLSNLIGLLIIKLCNKVGVILNTTALTLNIKQRIYSYNHKIITNCTHKIHKLIQPNYNQIDATLVDIKTWCEQQDLPYISISNEQQIDIAAPKLITPSSNITPMCSRMAKLSKAYLAEIDNATVIAGSKLILTDNTHIVLDNEIDTYKQQDHNLKNPFINHSSSENLKISFIKKGD